MSFYQKGLEVGAFLVRTPSEIQAYKNDVDRQIVQLGADIMDVWKTECRTPDGNTILPNCKWTPLKDAYGEFVAGWKKFYQSSSNWWSATYDKTSDYLVQLKDWRRKLESEGIKPTAPEPKIPQDSGPAWSTMLWIGVGILGAAIVVPPIIKAIKE